MIRYAYAWFWFKVLLKGPRRLWSRPVGPRHPDGRQPETWTALALYAFEWAGVYAYEERP